MTSLLKAAPAAGTTGTSGTMGALSQMTKSAGGLASATSAFTKLGLKPELVTKAIPVLTTFVTKSGGANIGKLLAGALK
jgi:predicted anti-sigma-YlaC factor YlaD